LRLDDNCLVLIIFNLQINTIFFASFLKIKQILDPYKLQVYIYIPPPGNGRGKPIETALGTGKDSPIPFSVDAIRKIVCSGGRKGRATLRDPPVSAMNGVISETAKGRGAGLISPPTVACPQPPRSPARPWNFSAGRRMGSTPPHRSTPAWPDPAPEGGSGRD
jgi:hypothetical protein